MKTKSFLAFILFLVAGLFLVACGPEYIPDPKAPLEMEISVDYSELGNGCGKVGGDFIELSVVVEEGYDEGVTWSSSNPSVATVDENGNVSPVSIGKAVITATSKLDNGVSAQTTVSVYGASAQEMLAECANYVTSAMPAYIQGGVDENGNAIRTKLPCDYLSEFVTYEYESASTKNENGIGYVKYYNHRYFSSDKWNDAGLAAQDTLKCTVKFKGNAAYSGSRDVIVQIKVVPDIEKNDYTALEEYGAAFDEFFAQYNGKDYAVEQLVVDFERSELLTITFETDNSVVMSISYDENQNPVFKYSKPIDNTLVNLKAVVMTASGQGFTKTVTVNALGYSKEDKVEYFRTVVAASIGALAGQRISGNVKLPTVDTTFDMQISWSSDAPEYLDGNGKYTDHMSEPVDQVKKVKLTATLTYIAADEFSTDPASFTSQASFVADVDFILDVYPCTDSARAINKVLDVNGCIGDQEEDGTYLGYFPYGRQDRANDQLHLPATLEEAGYTGEGCKEEWKSLPITWTCSEEGLFDADWNLLKQYLRYHPVTMSGKVTLGGVEETINITLNVGIGKYEGGVHVGGSFSRLAVQESELTTIAMDSLNTLSGFEEILGKMQNYYKETRTSEYYTQNMRALDDLSGSEYYIPDYDCYKKNAISVDKPFALGYTGGFGGVTLAWTNPDNGLHYTYYATEAFTWVITDDDVNDDGTLKTKWYKTVEGETVECSATDDKREYQTIPSLAGRNNRQYDGFLVINASSKNVKFPILYYSGENKMYPATKDGRIGTSTEAGGAISFYSGSSCSVITNGIVSLSAVENQNTLNGIFTDFSHGCTPEGGTEAIYPDYFILEPGAVGWDPCDGQDAEYSNAAGGAEPATKELSTTGLCTAGTVVEVSVWKIHACNTVTCTSRWTGEFGLNINRVINAFGGRAAE